MCLCLWKQWRVWRRLFGEIQIKTAQLPLWSECLMIQKLWYEMILHVKFRKTALLVVLAAILNALQQHQLLMWQQQPFLLQPRHQPETRYLSWVLIDLLTSRWLSISKVSLGISVLEQIYSFLKEILTKTWLSSMATARKLVMDAEWLFKMNFGTSVGILLTNDK